MNARRLLSVTVVLSLIAACSVPAQDPLALPDDPLALPTDDPLALPAPVPRKPAPATPPQAQPKANSRGHAKPVETVSVAISTPTPREVYVGQRLRIDYSFIYWGIFQGPDDPLAVPVDDPLAVPVSVTASSHCTLGSVAPRNQRFSAVLGTRQSGTFTYVARKAGREKVIVTVNKGSTTGRASLEFPVFRAKYRMVWNLIVPSTSGRTTYAILSGHGTFEQDDKGYLQGAGTQSIVAHQTGLLESGEFIELKPCVARGSFKVTGHVDESEQVHLTIASVAFTRSGEHYRDIKGRMPDIQIPDVEYPDSASELPPFALGEEAWVVIPDSKPTIRVHMIPERTR